MKTVDTIDTFKISDAFFDYIGGYYMNITLIKEALTKDNIKYLVFPLLFNVCNLFELTVKRAMLMPCGYIGNKNIKNINLSTHGMMSIINNKNFKDYLEKIGFTTKLYDCLHEIVLNFNNYCSNDNLNEAMRYPINKMNDIIYKQVEKDIDLTSFKNDITIFQLLMYKITDLNLEYIDEINKDNLWHLSEEELSEFFKLTGSGLEINLEELILRINKYKENAISEE